MAYAQLEDTPMWQDVLAVINAKKKTTRFKFDALIHTEDDDINIMKFINMDIVSDYVNNIGEVVFVTLMVALGDYVKRIYPYRQNLEVTVRRTEIEGNDEAEIVGKTRVMTTRYKAVFLVKNNPPIAASELERIDYASLNNQMPVDLRLQLIDRGLEVLRTKSVSGTYNDATVEEIIHATLGGESLNVLIDGKPAIDGIDVVLPDNLKPISNLILTSNKLIPSIPTYLQEKSKGVYSAGIGTFLQYYDNRRTWFVYPLFNTARFKDNCNKAIIYSLPKERIPSVDKSYLVNGNVLNICATGTMKYQDTGEADHMNTGVGFRQTNADVMMTKPVNITSDGAEASRLEINNEVAIRERDDGVQFAPVTEKRISSNAYTAATSIKAKEVSRIDINWEHSDPTLIYPGMPCRYTYLRGGNVITLDGVIVFVQTSIALTGNNINSAIATMNTVLVALCKLDSSVPVAPTGVENGDW